MGYTPAFDTIYTGTLFGRWPMAAVWASLLPLIDSRGQIDLSYEAIAGMIGWPMELLRQGISQLMEPDPGSRCEAEEGRRLVLLDPKRDWGWRAVNVQKYRERAGDANQTADGRNAAKVRRYKERHRRTPEDTGGHSTTLTHTHTHTQTREEQEGATAPGLDLKAWKEWENYRTATRKPLKSASRQRAQEELAKYGSRQSEVVAHSIANGYQGLFAPKNIPKPKAVQMNPDGTVAMFAGKPVEW